MVRVQHVCTPYMITMVLVYPDGKYTFDTANYLSLYFPLFPTSTTPVEPSQSVTISPLESPTFQTPLSSPSTSTPSQPSSTIFGKSLHYCSTILRQITVGNGRKSPSSLQADRYLAEEPIQYRRPASCQDVHVIWQFIRPEPEAPVVEALYLYDVRNREREDV
jgi:hypothetical protein